MKDRDETFPPDNITASLIATIQKLPLNRQVALLEDLCGEENEPPESREKEPEKRQHPRKALLLPVDYTAQALCYKDFIRNLSAGGVFIETSRPFAPGQTISMTFMSADNQHHFKFTGKIVRTLEAGIGIEFSDTAADENRKITEFLSDM